MPGQELKGTFIVVLNKQGTYDVVSPLLTTPGGNYLLQKQSDGGFNSLKDAMYVAGLKNTKL